MGESTQLNLRQFPQEDLDGEMWRRLFTIDETQSAQAVVIALERTIKSRVGRD
jgi:hypothetical protein